MTHTGVKIAAIGDIHCDPACVETVGKSLAQVAGGADLLLLAGDLTTHGQPEEAEALVQAVAGVHVPVVAVLGNHDHHAGCAHEVKDVLVAGGVTVLDGDHTIHRVGSVDVGVAGIKGFVGGFSGSHMPDFGEPSLRAIYRETAAEIDGLDRALKAIALCPVRVALMHYAPCPETVAGEPAGIHMMLGSDRLAAPIREHEPDAVFHGHAHVGCAEGRIGDVPVYNVAAPLTDGRPRVVELDPGLTTVVH